MKKKLRKLKNDDEVKENSQKKSVTMVVILQEWINKELLAKYLQKLVVPKKEKDQ